MYNLLKSIRKIRSIAGAIMVDWPASIDHIMEGILGAAARGSNRESFVDDPKIIYEAIHFLELNGFIICINKNDVSRFTVSWEDL
jgi:hypothetical protein